jgi:uncharacterized LabA/DUF88 family protein
MRRKDTRIEVGEQTEQTLGTIALFFDHENIALAMKRGKPRFNPALIIEHLSQRGDVVVRRAYADWGRYDKDQTAYLEQGVEMVFMPTYGYGDKNRTDTSICVDAMDILRLQPQIDTYVIVSGDSDFGVLARRLRSNAKRIVGISAKEAASKILVSVCHEFIFYEGLTGESLKGFDLNGAQAIIESVLPAIEDEYGDTFQPSLLKDRIRRKDSTFSERNYGCESFTALLEKFPDRFDIKRWKGGRNQVTLLG